MSMDCGSSKDLEEVECLLIHKDRSRPEVLIQKCPSESDKLFFNQSSGFSSKHV